MSEQILESIIQEVKALRRDVAQLSQLVKRDKIYDTWLPEADAAAILGISERTLRRLCSIGKLPICYRSTNGRKYQYHRKDLAKYQNNSSY